MMTASVIDSPTSVQPVKINPKSPFREESKRGKKTTTTPSLADAALVDVSGPAEEHEAPPQSAAEGERCSLSCRHLLIQSEDHLQSCRADIRLYWVDKK